MSKPMTRGEWSQHVADTFSQAVRETFEDQLKAALAVERAELEAELLKLKQGVASNSDYVQGRWDLIGEFQDIIKARNNK